jgi:molybdenum cofactor cytidylyltransferase
MGRSFAVIPAAGSSARMGAPKLLLPLGDQTIITQVLEAWAASSVTRTIVVVREDDQPLREQIQGFDVDVVTASPAPPDMKASVQLGLNHLQNHYQPADNDPWLMAPADSPRLSAEVIDALLGAYDPAAPMAAAPTFGDRRGHPVLLPWSYAARVRELLQGDGFDRVFVDMPFCNVPWCEPSILDKFNLPTDYARLAQAATKGSSGADG